MTESRRYAITLILDAYNQSWRGHEVVEETATGVDEANALAHCLARPTIAARLLTGVWSFAVAEIPAAAQLANDAFARQPSARQPSAYGGHPNPDHDPL